MRKTVEAQLLQFTLGTIFELKTPLVSEFRRWEICGYFPETFQKTDEMEAF